jgi:hypothetical protein
MSPHRRRLLIRLLAVPAAALVAWLVWRTPSPAGRTCRLALPDGSPVQLVATPADAAEASDHGRDQPVLRRMADEGRLSYVPTGTRARVVERPEAGLLLVELLDERPGRRGYVQEGWARIDR